MSIAHSAVLVVTLPTLLGLTTDDGAFLEPLAVDNSRGCPEHSHYNVSSLTCIFKTLKHSTVTTNIISTLPGMVYITTPQSDLRQQGGEGNGEEEEEEKEEEEGEKRAT